MEASTVRTVGLQRTQACHPVRTRMAFQLMIFLHFTECRGIFPPAPPSCPRSVLFFFTLIRRLLTFLFPPINISLICLYKI